MNPAPPTTSPGSATNGPPSASPRRSYLFLAVLALVALGLMLLPRPALYYPHVVIDSPGGIRLDFLLNGRQDQTACRSAANAVANAIGASCHECSTRELACLKNPPAELRGRFDEAPLPMPSARMANGVVTYTAAQAEVALLACRESERQAALRGDQAKVACHPAGAARPHTAFEHQNSQARQSTFTLLLASIGALLAAIVAGIIIAHRRHSALSPQSASLISHPWLEKLTLAGVDTLILLGTFLAFAWPESDNISRWSRIDRSTVIGHGIVVVLTVGWFWLLLEHYARRRPFWDELRETLRVLVIMAMMSGATAFVAGLEAGRASHLIVWALNFLLIPLGRAGARQLLDDLGLWQRPAVIIGTGENAREAWLAIRSERNMGYRLLGFVRVSVTEGNPRGTGETAKNAMEIDNETYPIIDESALGALPSSVQLFVALESLSAEKEQILVQRLVSRSNNVHLIPSIRGLPLFGTQLSHFFSHEVLLLTLRNNLARRGYKWIKRAFDLCVASLLLLLLAPLLLYLAHRIRRDGGKALYGHTRVGQNGKAFKCLKFRSMRSDADKVLKELLANDPAARAEWDKDFKLKNDPRITPVGHFLRKTSLDELPQLINVIKGEMSLVGPRPIVTAELERYGDYVNLYLQVLPGMTGLWQVSGRNDTGYDERVGLDAWYVQNWSLWYDIAILFKTIDVVFNRRGAY